MIIEISNLTSEITQAASLMQNTLDRLENLEESSMAALSSTRKCNYEE